MTSSVRLNKILLALADIVIYVAAFYLSFYLRYGWELPSYNMKSFTFMLPWFILTFQIMLIIYDLYSIYIKYDEILASLVCIIFLTALINGSLSFVFRQFAVPRLIFLLSSILQLLFLSIWRYIAWRKGLLIKNPRKALIIGFPGEIKKLINSVNAGLERGLVIIKEIRLTNKDNFVQTWGSYTSTSSSQEIEVILICSSVGQKERELIMNYALEKDKLIMLVPGIYEILLQQAKMVSAGDMPIIQLQGILAEGKPRVFKRVTDMLISIAALVILLPLVLFISLAIKIDSPGPVIYSQKRVGGKNKEFDLYKFRTMIKDAEKLSGPVMTGKGDRRVTRVGRLLRMSRLDELPQFINVLKGDISLVGPRPERPFFIDEFREEIPEFDYRHHIQGGVTGLAQVEGNYTTDPSNKLRYDLYYAQKKSIIMDIVILLRTARVMLQRNKAS